MKIIINNKSLLIFTFLNYVDKALSFVLPLIVLYLLNDVTLYNDLEYIFSYANIIVILADLGLRMFFLYNYPKQINDEKNYLSSVKSYFYIMSLFYLLIGIVFTIISLKSNTISVLIPFIFVRMLILLFTNFFNIYYRLIDKPQNALYYSIIINLITILVTLVFVKWLHVTNSLMFFFLTQALFVIWYSFKGIRYLNKKNLKEMFKYITDSLIYAWPLILNVLILTFVNNYGKIYAFNHLSKTEMFSFSYTLRIAMIIQMAHTSVIAYNSKEIYLDSNKKINFKVYKQYNLFLFIALVLSIVFLKILNSINITPAIQIDYSVISLIIYVFLWCQVAYFEQYLSKYNMNFKILLFAVLGCFVYLVLLFFFKDYGIIGVVFSMTISIIINLSAILTSMYKLKLLR